MQLLPASADGVAVLSVRGPVLPEEADRLVGAVETAWSDRPRGVVVDLREATSLAAEALAALDRLARRARPWPHPSLSLCCPPEGTAVEGIAVHPDRDEALSHVDDRSAAPRRRFELPAGPQGPAYARRAVAECAERFGFEVLRDDLELVVSEMVTNALRHATGPVTVELEADGSGMVVAVGDGSPTAPSARDAGEDAENGRGLLLVDLLSVEHGVRPDPPGKTVWAALALPGSR